MENSNQENKTTETPKPTDQVQLDIETVTPETEKDVVPTTEANKPKDEKEQNEIEEKPSDIEGKADHLVQAETLTVNKTNQSELTENNDAIEAEKETDEDNDDERDQIETISP